jgi:hypothetical protein
VGDEVSAGAPHVRRVGLKPFGDFFQLGSQLRLSRCLALLPLPGLVPDCTPPTSFRPSRVHRDAALQLDHLAAASGCGTSAATREDPGAGRAAGLLRPPGGWCGALARQLWGFCGDLGLRGRVLRHRGRLSSCVDAGKRADGFVLRGAGERIRTADRPLTRRMLCQAELHRPARPVLPDKEPCQATGSGVSQLTG